MKISFVTSLVGSLTVFVFGSTLTSETVNAGNWNVGGSGSTFVQPENYVVVPQTDPGGKAVKYGNSAFTTEMPENARPNDATISLYQNGRKVFFDRRKSQGNLYTITPKGNAELFESTPNPKSKILEAQLTKGYILSYLFYDKGTIKYDGLPKAGRLAEDLNDQTLFFTHSTGKSIISYIIGHAICEGHITSIDERIDWPLMSKTLYQGQPLRNLLNMSAGDKHTIDHKRSHYIMGKRKHHRDMDLVTIAKLLEGTKPKGDKLFYNNFLSDVLASYVAFKAGDEYDRLLQTVFQDKIKIENEVHFELHKQSSSGSSYRGQIQTRASYSFLITRKDLLRVAVAMMKDYQQQTCVGKYLKASQAQARKWPKYSPSKKNAKFILNKYARKYGAQIYFDFLKMDGRNILGTEGKSSQNILIDMDNSRIVVTQSAAPAWDQRIFMLNVISDGKLPN